MKPTPAIVQPAVDVSDVSPRAIAAFRAVKEAEEAAKKSRDNTKSKRATAAERRIELGKILIEARSRFVLLDARAAGFVQWCKKEVGIPKTTAQRFMVLAGYVENSDPHSANVVPTFADAGIDSRPRRGDSFDPQREAVVVREKLLKAAAKWPPEYRKLLAIELRNASKDIEVMK